MKVKVCGLTNSYHLKTCIDLNADYCGFILNYTIDAGKRYRFSKMTANVSQSLDKSAFSSLENEFNKVVGEYYSFRKTKKVENKIWNVWILEYRRRN